MNSVEIEKIILEDYNVLPGMFVESLSVFQHKENEDYYCICDFENNRIGFAYSLSNTTMSIRDAFSYNVMFQFSSIAQLKKILLQTFIN